MLTPNEATVDLVLWSELSDELDLIFPLPSRVPNAAAAEAYAIVIRDLIEARTASTVRPGKWS